MYHAFNDESTMSTIALSMLDVPANEAFQESVQHRPHHEAVTPLASAARLPKASWQYLSLNSAHQLNVSAAHT